jgi:sulfide dehydrogenase cytochrome subunit
VRETDHYLTQWCPIVRKPETKHLLLCCALLSIAIAHAGAQENAHDPADAITLALACSGCHDAQADKAGLPLLTGMDTLSFIQHMNDFKSGKRKSSIMNRIARGYDETELQKMADYFSRQKPSLP